MADVVLTKAQQAVVDNRGGALLVSAAAGSGKTKVLVDRLLGMVLSEHDPHHIDEFLMITYTKAAAAELRSKILAAMQERLSREPDNRRLQREITRLYLAQISTVHAFCAAVLREYAYLLDIPADFRVLEESECRALRQRAMDAAIDEAYEHMNADFRAFADTLGSGRDDRRIGEIVSAIFRSAQTHRDPDSWLEESVARFSLSADADFGTTPWGTVLLDDLRETAADAAAQMRRAAVDADADPALKKAYLPALLEDIALYDAIASAATWENAANLARNITFASLKSVRKCDDPDVKETIKTVRNECKDTIRKKLIPFALSSCEATEETASLAAGIRGAAALTRRFAVLYKKEKQRRRGLDFGDLEHEMLRLLYGHSTSQPTAAARAVAERFCEILVDEYQDSNEVQDAIFHAVSGEGRKLFMVGDVKQSIYRFRLADPTIFLEKYKTFAHYEAAAEGQPRKIVLSENFRSRKDVLDAANCVFRRCMSERCGDVNYGEAEELRAGLPYPETDRTAVELHCIAIEAASEEDELQKAKVEARFTAHRITQLLRSGTSISGKDGLRPVCAEDIAILLRSPRSVAGYYIEALRECGIPCACDMGEDMLQTTELQVLSSFLEIVENPHQDIPLLAVLASPLCGFTANDLAFIRAAAKDGDFYDVLCASERENAKNFIELLHRLRDTAEHDGLVALMDAILRETDAVAVFRAMRGGHARVANIRCFCDLASAHAANGGDLTGFVRTVRDLREDGLPMQSEAAAGAVTLTSIHKSKGLEYPIVFLCGLSQNFNLEDLRKPLLTHPDLGITSNMVDLGRKVRYTSVSKTAMAERMKREAVSEELRVLYVAMTRAREMLIMTCCAAYLESHMKKLRALRVYASKEQLAARALNFGDWILSEALGRTEAGALFAVTGEVNGSAVQAYPWKIAFHNAADVMREEVEPIMTATVAAAAAPIDASQLAEELDYRYPHLSAAQLPSKITATQLKGRRLDEEIAAYAPALRTPMRKPPAFLGESGLTATEVGTSLHLAMQFIRYECCRDIDGVRQELVRLREEEFLTEEQAEAVQPEKILTFFRSPLGQRVLAAEEIRREFKFSLLLDAEEGGERIMLQGVCDCCLIEEEGVTV
ncbi:MAG: helicase-exonuclease AddAB subunit AddA, partial [Oscillospiraceae bacterium]|nr:helicase-exonuclease AddAB subunit AddA [Oscillospiraceae bacterium]